MPSVVLFVDNLVERCGCAEMKRERERGRERERERERESLEKNGPIVSRAKQKAHIPIHVHWGHIGPTRGTVNLPTMQDQQFSEKDEPAKWERHGRDGRICHKKVPPKLLCQNIFRRPCFTAANHDHVSQR